MKHRCTHRHLTLPMAAASLLLPAIILRAQEPASSPALPDAPSTTTHQEPPAQPTGPIALFDTSLGRLTCQLFDHQAPETVANFVGLATGSKPWIDPETHKKITGRSFYNGTTFHRVIPGFMIQGGDRLGTGMGDAGYIVPDEITSSLRFDVPGRLAMANAGPNSAGSQFFITEAANAELNGSYTIFGQCDPHSVLIAATIARTPRDHDDKPLTPVILNRVTILPAGSSIPPDPALPPAPSGTTAPSTSPTAPAAAAPSSNPAQDAAAAAAARAAGTVQPR